MLRSLAGLRSVTAPREEERRKESDRQPVKTLSPHGHMHTHTNSQSTHHRCTFLLQNPDISLDELEGTTLPSTCPTPPPKLSVRLSTSCMTSSRSPVKCYSLLDAEGRKSCRGEHAPQKRSIFPK